MRSRFSYSLISTYRTAAKLVFFTKGSRFLHHRRRVVTVESRLVRPFINKEKAFRIIGRKKVVITEATFDSPDAVGNSAFFHFPDIFSGRTILAGVSDIDRQLSITRIVEDDGQK